MHLLLAKVLNNMCNILLVSYRSGFAENRTSQRYYCEVYNDMLEQDIITYSVLGDTSIISS